MEETFIPKNDWIYRFIEEIYSKGVRRPGYPADRWAVEFSAEQFREMGLENVRLEPVTVPYWEPHSWSLQVKSKTGEYDLPCFPLPYTAPTEAIELELVSYDPVSPEKVRGKASFHSVQLLRIPTTAPAGDTVSTIDRFNELEMNIRPGGRIIDERGSMEETQQVVPFSPQFQNVMEPAIDAEAAAYIGTLIDYPGDSYEYYVPYDGLERPIPGMWIRGSDGVRLQSMLESGTVQVRLQVDSLRKKITDHNVIGELAGMDEEMIVIGSHHDGPWSSAVEDASGMALVLAQAAYWSKVRLDRCPHRLVFLLNAGHMAGAAGCRAFIDKHAQALERIVLEIHLEHAARELIEKDGELVQTCEPEARWFFTSRNPFLENALAEALNAERFDRSLIIPPDVFGERPTTDGGHFHLVGVPLVNYLTAPFYLFDAMDTLDKIHVPSLEPVTRVTIRLIESTKGISAATMRSSTIS